MPSKASAGPLFPGPKFAASDGPQSVAVADLDGDTVPDLVTANVFGDDVSVLLNQTAEPDGDQDGIADAEDNCTEVWNPDQADFDAGTDDDPSIEGVQHYGDRCDPDLDNDGTVGFNDLFDGFLPCLNQPALLDCAASDFDGDGFVGFNDLFDFFLPRLNMAPGPGVTAAGGVFALGSSFSWDSQPNKLDNEPEWHIYCAKPLDYIFNNPTGHCVASSTPWPDVLEPPAVPYDYISFQPIKGASITRAQDISHITYWLTEQPPYTVAVIHNTWPRPANWEAQLHEPNPDHTFANYSIAYTYDLMEQLELANPGRTFVSTRANEMLDYIFHDPLAPIVFDDLFRDSGGHMSHNVGRYLQHNAFRQAMGQEIGIDVTRDGVDPLIGDYLDQVIELHPSYQ